MQPIHLYTHDIKLRFKLTSESRLIDPKVQGFEPEFKNIKNGKSRCIGWRKNMDNSVRLFMWPSDKTQKLNVSFKGLSVSEVTGRVNRSHNIAAVPYGLLKLEICVWVASKRNVKALIREEFRLLRLVFKSIPSSKSPSIYKRAKFSESTVIGLEKSKLYAGLHAYVHARTSDGNINPIKIEMSVHIPKGREFLAFGDLKSISDDMKCNLAAILLDMSLESIPKPPGFVGMSVKQPEAEDILKALQLLQFRKKIAQQKMFNKLRAYRGCNSSPETHVAVGVPKKARSAQVLEYLDTQIESSAEEIAISIEASVSYVRSILRKLKSDNKVIKIGWGQNTSWALYGSALDRTIENSEQASVYSGGYASSRRVENELMGASKQ